MYIRLGSDGVSLEEPEDVKRFSVVAPAGADVDRALRDAGFGQTEGEQALVEVAAVQQAAAGRVGASWPEDFERMLDFAAGKGWLTEDRRQIRAHIEVKD